MDACQRRILKNLLPLFLGGLVSAQLTGSGTTTRYWDCCKPSCAWPGKTALAAGANPVAMCDIHDNPITDYNAVSGCETGGTAFMPSSESPWAINDNLAYGYAAVNIAGGTEASWCCACYELTFTSGPVMGKKMVVQATNTGGDLGSNQFDLAIPGGGVGMLNGCTAEWGAPSSGWGAQYGGVSSNASCDAFPEALKPGCQFRFGWFADADNPTADFTQVTCPPALTAKTGCIRAGDIPTGSNITSNAFRVGISTTSKVLRQSTVLETAAIQSSSKATQIIESSPTLVSSVLSNTIEAPVIANLTTNATSTAAIAETSVPNVVSSIPYTAVAAGQSSTATSITAAGHTTPTAFPASPLAITASPPLSKPSTSVIESSSAATAVISIASASASQASGIAAGFVSTTCELSTSEYAPYASDMAYTSSDDSSTTITTTISSTSTTYTTVYVVEGQSTVQGVAKPVVASIPAAEPASLLSSAISIASPPVSPSAYTPRTSSSDSTTTTTTTISSTTTTYTTIYVVEVTSTISDRLTSVPASVQASVPASMVEPALTTSISPDVLLEVTSTLSTLYTATSGFVGIQEPVVTVTVYQDC